MTIQEAARRLGKSEATIRRWIKQGKLAATMVEGKYEIPESALNAYTGPQEHIGTAYTTVELEHLRRQNEELLKQVSDQKAKIESLESGLEQERRRADEADQRHDTIVLQLTRQLEQSQRLLEYHQDPWYRRWFRRRRGPEE